MSMNKHIIIKSTLFPKIDKDVVKNHYTLRVFFLIFCLFCGIRKWNKNVHRI